MDRLEQIIALLQDRNFSVIAQSCGVSRVTIKRIAERKHQPSYPTLEKLEAYFKDQKK